MTDWRYSQWHLLSSCRTSCIFTLLDHRCSGVGDILMDLYARNGSEQVAEGDTRLSVLVAIWQSSAQRNIQTHANELGIIHDIVVLTVVCSLPVPSREMWRLNCCTGLICHKWPWSERGSSLNYYDGLAAASNLNLLRIRKDCQGDVESNLFDCMPSAPKGCLRKPILQITVV